jgi:hypothetical protein
MGSVTYLRDYEVRDYAHERRVSSGALLLVAASVLVWGLAIYGIIHLVTTWAS